MEHVHRRSAGIMTRSTRASSRCDDLSSEVSSNARIIKNRRSHTKSRNGCIECKTRHIRCDERQPSCVNCENAERTCVYPPKASKQKQQSTRRPGSRKRKQQIAATASLSPSPGLGGHRNGNSFDNEDADLGHMQPSSLALRSELQTEHVQAPDQSSHRLQLRHNGLPVTSADEDLDQAPLPAPGSNQKLFNVENPLADCLPGFLSEPDTVSEATFTLQHMVLLRYADTVPNFAGENRSIVDIAIRHAVESPYLIDEVLAFAAFHLAHVFPGSARLLNHIATELQTRALASFTHLTEDIPTDDEATAVPRFLFSSILGRHYLAETLAHHRYDFHLFVDRIAGCFNINRGIKAVTPRARDFLYESELRPFLDIPLNAQSKITAPGNECDSLSRLMDSCDLSEASVRACRQTISLLQQSFDTLHHLEEEDYPQSASTFSVHVESGFVDALRKHQPEALIILAYYGVLLHYCRTFWAFHDAGSHIVRAIAQHLGVYWQEALAWPLAVVGPVHYLGLEGKH